jgi:uncharacterized membrane protein (DUF373 family)
MSELQIDRTEKDDTPHHHEHAHNHSVEEPTNQFAVLAGDLLDRADTYIYATVGICFLLGIIVALVYSFWDFGVGLMAVPTQKVAEQPGVVAGVIIRLISDLLLVLIITEVLGTVIHYLKEHVTSLRPFLFIGIISATRGILSVSAKLSVGQNINFNEAMIELGVHAAVVLALGITLKLLGRNFEIGPDR